MVTDYGGHRRSIRDVQEINPRACMPLIFAQTTGHTLELNAGHAGSLFPYLARRFEPPKQA